MLCQYMVHVLNSMSNSRSIKKLILDLYMHQKLCTHLSYPERCRKFSPFTLLMFCSFTHSQAQNSYFPPLCVLAPCPLPELIISGDILDKQPGLQSHKYHRYLYCNTISHHVQGWNCLFFYFFLLQLNIFAKDFAFICAAGGLCKQDGGWRGDRYGVGPGSFYSYNNSLAK